jgi:molybdopterin-guanine dinucleotide biosynthesis protein A
MPGVNLALIESLAAQRDPSAIATALRHPDGTAEPMCAIWEAAARSHVHEELTTGSGSLRRVLERGNCAFASWGEPHMLQSINTPGEHARWQGPGGPRRGGRS